MAFKAVECMLLKLQGYFDDIIDQEQDSKYKTKIKCKINSNKLSLILLIL